MKSNPQNEPPVVSAASRWVDFLKISVALLLIGFVLSRTSLREVIALGDIISWSWLIVSFLLYCWMTALKGWQYWVLLGRRETTYMQTLKIVVIQNALTNFVANAAGFLSYLTLLRVEHSVNLGRSGVAFLITKMGDLLSIGFFLWVSSYWVWDRIEKLRILVTLLLVGTAALFMVFGMSVLLRRGFTLRVKNLCQRLRLNEIGFIQRGLDFLNSLASQDHAVVLKMLVRGALLSMLYMTVSMLYSFCRVQIFHIPIDFWAVVFIASLMQFVSAIPFQVFGGLGVTELSSLYLYNLFGIVGVDVPAVLVGLRILFYLFNAVILLYIPIEIFAGRFKRLDTEEKK